jgi:hypothetical protein
MVSDGLHKIHRDIEIRVDYLKDDYEVGTGRSLSSVHKKIDFPVANSELSRSVSYLINPTLQGITRKLTVT